MSRATPPLTLTVNSNQVSVAVGSLNNLSVASGQAERSVATLASGSNALEVRFSSLVRIAAQLVGAVSALGTIKWAVELEAQAERAEAGIRALTSSAAEANSMIAQIEDLSKRRPFGFIDLEKQSQFMMAMGIEGKKVVPILEAMADAVSALGGDQERMDRMSLSLSRMFDEGTVQSREMTQLARQGVQSWRILAEAIGTDIPGAMDAVRKRMVPSVAAIDAFAIGMKNQFHALGDEMAHSLPGQWDILKNRMNLGLRDLGAQIVTTFNIRGLLEGSISSVDKYTKAITSALGNNQNAIKAVLAGAAAFAALQVAIQGASLAWALFDAALLSNPFTAAAVAIAAAVGALYYYRDTQIEIGGQSEKLRDVVVGVWGELWTTVETRTADAVEVIEGLFGSLGLKWEQVNNGMKAASTWLAHLMIDLKTELYGPENLNMDDVAKQHQLIDQGANDPLDFGLAGSGITASQFKQNVYARAAANRLAREQQQRYGDLISDLPTQQDLQGLSEKQKIPHIDLIAGADRSSKNALRQLDDMVAKEKLEYDMVYKTNEERQRAEKILRLIEVAHRAGITDQKQINDLVANYEQVLMKVQQAQALKRLADDIGQSFADAFTEVATGAKKATDAIRDLAMAIEKMIIQQVVAKPLANAISGAITGGFGSFAGGLFSVGGNVGRSTIALAPPAIPTAPDAGGFEPFALGGIVDSPTPFSHGRGRSGVYGERGPEVIIPVGRDSSGRMGLKGGVSKTVNISMVINTPSADDFRKSRRQIMADFKRAAQ